MYVYIIHHVFMIKRALKPCFFRDILKILTFTYKFTLFTPFMFFTQKTRRQVLVLDGSHCSHAANAGFSAAKRASQK